MLPFSPPVAVDLRIKRHGPDRKITPANDRTYEHQRHSETLHSWTSILWTDLKEKLANINITKLPYCNLKHEAKRLLAYI